MVPFLFAAVHQGPYLSIRPLEQALGGGKVAYLVDGVAKAARAKDGLAYLDMDHLEQEWGSLDSLLERSQVKAVIRSTSEDVVGCNVEALASEAADRMGIPVFVVEDFPGNYRASPVQRLDGLFVEDSSMIELHCSRGLNPDIIFSYGNPRYSGLAHLDRQGLRLETRTALGLTDEPVLLWAGQPDGGNSYLAFERLLQGFPSRGAVLLFRAHPRDEAYQNGKYRRLLADAGSKVIDTSAYTNSFGLYCAADLVATQFSSAGVEASHLGTPALFVLFNDLAKEFLRTHKGYDTLPWCNHGSSFLIESEDEVEYVLEQALFDRECRQKVLSNFHRQFGVSKDCPQRIARRILDIVQGEDRPASGSTPLNITTRTSAR